MAIYNVSYDLHAPGRNYQVLIDEIKNLGSWAHPTESMWLIDSNLPLTQIRDILQSKIDRNDTLLVTICDKGAAWHNISPEVAVWIKARL